MYTGCFDVHTYLHALGSMMWSIPTHTRHHATHGECAHVVLYSKEFSQSFFIFPFFTFHSNSLTLKL